MSISEIVSELKFKYLTFGSAGRKLSMYRFITLKTKPLSMNVKHFWNKVSIGLRHVKSSLIAWVGVIPSFFWYDTDFFRFFFF